LLARALAHAIGNSELGSRQELDRLIIKQIHLDDLSDPTESPSFLRRTMPYGQAESFVPRDSLVRSTLRTALVLFIPLVVLTWLIVTLILNALHVPVPGLVGIFLGGALSVVLYRARAKQLEAQIGGMTLTFDSRGITQKDPVATRSVSWDGLRGGRIVKPVVGMSTGKVGRAGMKSKTPGVDALSLIAAGQEVGLVGIGAITLTSSAGMMQRETFRQNETRNGVDPATGQPLVALYLEQFDPAWPDERIGEWVRHFRPDVFAEAKAIFDQQGAR
jgi:hypothetical protein